MAERKNRVNQFGFAETPDMADLAIRLDSAALAAALEAAIDLVLGGDDGDDEFMDSLSDEAQSNFIVPLQMAAKLVMEDDYTAVELISAACTVRCCAERHFAEFPQELVDLLMKFPR